MFKMEKGEIEKTINSKIRSNYQTMEWMGVQLENVSKLLTVKATLGPNFQYKGKGVYSIEGRIEFEEKVSEGETISQFYQILPPNSVQIEESESGAKIEFASPIYLNKI